MRPGQKRIAIIGAGISGLAAAHRLHELDASLDLAVFESSDRFGGVIRSENFQGFCIEHGPDSLLTQVPWGLGLCHRVGIAADLVGTSQQHQGVYTVCHGRLRRVPAGLALMAPQRLWPLIASPILSIRGKLRLACEYFIPPRQESTDESLAQFATRRLGREAFERLVQPLVSGIYMGSPDCLSVRATFPRFVEMEAKHGSLMRAMWKKRVGKRRHRPNSEQQVAKSTAGLEYGMFVAPRAGMEQLTTAIAARLPCGAIRLQSRVQELTRLGAGQWRLITLTGPDETHTEFFDAVIVATSAPAASRLLADAAPALAAELRAIDHSSCLVANMAFRREQLRHALDAFGFVSPRIENRSVTACTFSSVKYPGRAPQDRCLLRAFLGGTTNPQALDWPDSQVKHVVQNELSALLGITGEPLFFKVQRWGRAMPQYELGHLERIERIEQIVKQVPSLALAGNAYHGAGVAHCIHSGEVAAELLHEHFESEKCFSNVRS